MSAADISLDADSGLINFKDDGTQFGKIRNISSNLYLYSDVQDKDIVFRGNDGGADVDALTLDMSDAGAATFNGSLKAGSYVHNSLLMPHWQKLSEATGQTSETHTISMNSNRYQVTFNSTNAQADFELYGARLTGGQWTIQGIKIGNGTPVLFNGGTTVSDTNNTYTLAVNGGSNQMTFSRTTGSTAYDICIKTKVNYSAV